MSPWSSSTPLEVIRVFPPVGGHGTIYELDLLFSFQFALALAHALRARDRTGALKLLIAAFAVGFAVEYASVHLGGTHCHASGALNFSECSSVSSVLMYAPWIYTTVTCARRLAHNDASPTIVAFAGALSFFMCGPYELQGPLMGWWLWPRPDGLVKEGSTLWQIGEPAADTRGLVVAPHALDALEERVFGVPVMAPYFHAAFAVGIAGMGLTTAFRWPVLATAVGPMAALLCDPPVRAMRAVLSCKFAAAVPATMVAALVSVLFAGPALPSRGRVPRDCLLFAVPAIEHTYMLANALLRPLGAAAIPPNLKVLLLATSCMAASAFGRACGLWHGRVDCHAVPTGAAGSKRVD